MKNLPALAAPRHAIAAAVFAALALPAAAADWEVTGLIRQEIAVKTTNDQNQQNQYGNPDNGRPVTSEGLQAVFREVFPIASYRRFGTPTKSTFANRARAAASWPPIKPSIPAPPSSRLTRLISIRRTKTKTKRRPSRSGKSGS